jgi:hypothetical protein
MTLLEQEQGFAAEQGRGGVGPACRRVPGLDRQQEAVVEQADRLELGMLDRQGQDEHVEHAAQQLLDQDRGLRLTDLQGQGRMALLQAGQGRRQEIGGDRGDRTQPQGPGQEPALVPRVVHEVADLGQDALRASGDLLALLGQGDPAAAALEQDSAEERLELLDLHRERRLADGAGLGGPAEMPMAGQGREVAQLPQRDHDDRISLSWRSVNIIRSYGSSCLACARRQSRRAAGPRLRGNNGQSANHDDDRRGAGRRQPELAHRRPARARAPAGLAEYVTC